jgi:hypothetical protein
MNEERQLAEVELEGGGITWWYVCGECHGTVNYKAKECQCGAVLKWDGVLLPSRKVYTGEQTEPAE